MMTNNQNQIKSRDLRANDPVQLDMEEGFRNYGFLYERKPRQYDDTTIDPTRLFTNEAVAQCYLAIVLKTPSDGRARKYKVWGELHSRIFSGQSIEPYIVAALIGRSAADWLRGTQYTTSEDEVLRIIAKRGSFHIGRIASYLWRETDNWSLDRATLQTQLADLQGGKLHIEKIFEEAFSILSRVVQGSAEYSGDVDRALKSALLDKEIDRQLHKNGKDA
jgi:hypothetical protein